MARPAHYPAKPVLFTLSTDLGWMAWVAADGAVGQLVFGYASARRAIDALGPGLIDNASPGPADDELAQRLQAYAAGKPVDFRDVRVDTPPVSDFHRRVLHACRQIPYGQTCTYGELARRAGSPRAARAVGRCMAINRVPLIIPCHRVTASDGRLGGFSAPGGIRIKERLLAMEAGR